MLQAGASDASAARIYLATRYRGTRSNHLASRLRTETETGMSRKPAKKTAKKSAEKSAKKPVRKAAAPKRTAAKSTASKKPAAKAATPRRAGGTDLSWNFKLLAHDTLAGFGGMGEGMAVQVAKDGRRVLWLAHESAPKNFTAVDVSDPRKP